MQIFRTVALSSLWFLFLSSLRADPLDQWQQRYPLPTEKNLTGIAHGNGLFIAVGRNGTILTSADGLNWTNQWFPIGNMLQAVTFGDGLFVAVGSTNRPSGSSQRLILTSSDGVNWTNRIASATNQGGLFEVNHIEGRFWAFGQNKVITSPNGLAWTEQPTGANQPPSALIAFGNDRFVAVGNRGAIWTSADGITWTQRNSGTLIDLSSVTYGRDGFVAVGGQQTVLTSPDGVTWIRRIPAGLPKSYNLGSLTYASGVYLASAGTVPAVRSEDGINWMTVDNLKEFSSVTFGDGRFVAVGFGGSINTSSNGINWTLHTWPDFPTRGMVFGRSKFVIAAVDEVLISEDGVSWSRQKISATGKLVNLSYVNSGFWGHTVGPEEFSSETKETLAYSLDGIDWKPVYTWTNTYETRMSVSLPAYGNSHYVSVGTLNSATNSQRAGFSLISSDGRNWTRHDIATRDDLGPLVYGDGKFAAAGWHGWTGKSEINLWSSTDGVTWQSTPPLASIGLSPSDAIDVQSRYS